MSASVILSALIATSVVSPQTLLRQLLREPALKGAFVGVSVVNRSGKVLAQFQADKLMMPASNQKLLSCTFAVAKLGWNYRHKTSIWRKDNVVWIRGGNDPLLTTTDITAAAAGGCPVARIVLPYSPQYGMGWEIDDRRETYLPKVSPIVVDGGLHQIHFANGESWLEPRDAGITLSSATGTGPPIAAFDVDNLTLTLTGKWPPVKPIFIPQTDPVRVVAGLIADRYEMASAPPSETADVVIVGRTLADAVRTCMIDSDNRIAEMLLMSAGGAKTIQESAASMQSFWESQGVRKGEIRAVDGSGLSRHNLVTARAMSTAMRVALKHGMGTKRALATPGNGTLRNRFQGIRFGGKTGTLDTVSCLTGVLEEDGIVVSVLVNHAISPVRNVVTAVDRFVKGLASYYAVGTNNATSHSHDTNPAQPSNHPAHADRIYRPGDYGAASFARTDRGTQSSDEADHRERRNLVRSR